MSAVLDVTPRKQLSVLIVQLGEIEEVFRSLMAVKAVKQLYPETKFQFVVRHSHDVPLRRLDWIDGIIEIPVIEANEDPLKKVAGWVNQVIDQSFDILCNWTYSKRHQRMSSILATLIPAAVKFGNHVRNDFTEGGFDAWSIYREAWLRDQTIDQDIHHTDIITTQLLTALQVHSGDPTDDSSSSNVTSRYFFKTDNKVQFPKTASKWIAVHPDSLNARYEEVIEMILRRHPDHGVVVLNETALGDDSGIPVDHPRVLNLSGKLDFDSLVTALTGSAWLIAGRAPIVDLANLLNVRILYWIEAHPRITGEALGKWTETGPYGNGNIAVRFAEDFQPEVFYAIWSYAQSEWFHKGTMNLATHFENIGVTGLAGAIEVYKSRIRSAQEGGGVSFEPVIESDTTFENWMFRLRGQVARSWFCGWIPPMDSEVEKLKLNPALIKRSREIRESLHIIEQVCTEGKEVSKGLHQVALQIRNPKIMPVEDREAIDSYGKKLIELEGLISRVVQVEKELRCFLVWYQQLMHNLNGETLDQMANETYQAFDLLSDGIVLVGAYVERVLQKAKPKAITLSENVSPLEEK